MNKRLALVLASFTTLLFAPGRANAQIPYSVDAPVAGTAPTRTGWTAITFTGESAGSPTNTCGDSGYIDIALPFSFSYYGTAYTSLTATADGLILFDNTSNVIPGGPAAHPGCGYRHYGQCANTTSSVQMPDVTVPNNMIAFWWSDMYWSSPSGNASWTTSGTSPDQIFSLKYENWGAFETTSGGGKSPRTVQIELHETTGQIEVYYGAITVSTTNGDPGQYGASVGIEGKLVSGAVDAVTGLACTNRALNAPGATGPNYRCRTADWPTGQVIRYAPSNLPDLKVLGVSITSITGTTVNGNPGFEANLTVSIENHGLTAATGADFDVYYTSALTNPTQNLLQRYSSVAGNSTFTVAPQTTLQKTITVDFERPTGSGKFYFAAVVDPTNAVVEAVETNNTYYPKTNDFFQVGADLVAASISTTVTSASFGQVLPVTLTVHNGGTDTISTFTAEVWLSASQNSINTGTTGTPSVLLDTITVPAPGLSGGQDFTTTKQIRTNTGTVSLNAGNFYLVLHIPPPPLPPGVSELNPNNNNVGTSQIQFGFADLYCVNTDFHVTTTTAPYTDLTQIYFGDVVRISYKAGNRGTSAIDFDNGITITTGPNIKPMNTSSNYLATCTTMDGTPGALDHLTYATNMAATVFEVLCTIPSVNSANNPLPESPSVNWTIGIYVDGWSLINESDETESSNECKKTINIRRPAMDLVANSLEVPTAAAVGEIVPVSRSFSNLGNVAGPFHYQYVLSSNDVISTMDLALPVVVGTEVQPVATGTLAANGVAGPGIDSRTDLVMIPADASPGLYFVGVILDPNNELVELDKTNNSLRSLGTVQVLPSAIAIITQALPDAVLGAQYLQQLVAVGGDGLYGWEVLQGQGTLPDGLALSSDGVLSGTPTAAGDFEFVVRATCGTQVALARLVMRVVNPTGSLAIQTTQLPPALKQVAYSADLVAMGGVQPYSWALSTGDTLPTGLTLDPAGKVKGTAIDLINDKLFSVIVTDAHGDTATGVIQMRVVDANALAISAIEVGSTQFNQLPVGQVGVRYAPATFLAANAVGNVTWAIAGGQLPDGMEFTEGALQGVPTQTGVFPLTIEVRDDAKNRDAAPFVLVIMPRAARFDPITLNAVKQGESFLVELSNNTDPKANAHFALYSGELPTGLSLTSGGRISGVVDVNAAVGSYDFVVQVIENTGGTTLVPLTIRVNAADKLPPKPSSGGCSAGGAGPVSLGLLFALMVPVALRRRAVRAVPFAAVAAAALALTVAPGIAQAKPYNITHNKEPIAGGFQSITGTPIALSPNNPTQPTINLSGSLDLPFQIRLFDNFYTKARIGCRGYVSFDPAPPAAPSSALVPNATGIPSSTTTNFPMVAPWWGNWECAQGQVSYEVTGTAPFRVITFQWKDVYYAPDTEKTAHGATFQARIYETTWKVEFLYGNSLHSQYQDPANPGATVSKAAVGIQSSNTNGVAGMDCTTQWKSTAPGANCLPTDAWAQGTYITLEQPPDLTVTRVVADPVIYAGVAARMGATIWNRGGQATANPVSVRFYISTVSSPSPRTVDPELGDAIPAIFAVDQTRTMMMAPKMPGNLLPGIYYLYAKVDPDNVIDEGDKEGNNIAPAGGLQVTVGPPTPDLTPGTITLAGGTPAPDQTIQVLPSIKNVGNGVWDGTSPIPYKYYWSYNPIVTVGDTALGGDFTMQGTISGLNGELHPTAADTVRLPANVSPGTYYLCIVIDPDGTMTAPEITKTNNFCAAGLAIPIVSDTLTVTTASMPDAYVDLPYSTRVAAAGGTGEYHFARKSGDMPKGLVIDGNGLIHGMPNEEGSSTFTVEVTSGSAIQDQELTITVRPAGIPLTVLSQELAAGEFNHPYQVSLVAVGGKAPYTWALATGAAMPPGLVLGPDGNIEGIPTLDGKFNIDVDVTDGLGTQARGKLMLQIFAPARVTVATTALNAGLVGQSYNIKLQAVGGAAPYRWTVVQSVRVPTDPSDTEAFKSDGSPADPITGNLPTGLGLRLQTDGVLSATSLLKVGTYVLTFKVEDRNTDMDTASFVLRVTADKELRILTLELPDALVGKPYEAYLFADGPMSADKVKWKLTCEPTMNAQGVLVPCTPGANLPANFTLDDTGHFSTSNAMVAAITEADGSKPAAKVFTFMVEARDENGRTAVAPYSITVRQDPAAQDHTIAPATCGCGAVAGSGLPAGMGVILVLGLGMLGRRRRA